MKQLLLITIVVTMMLPAAGMAQTAGQTAVHPPSVKIGWMDAETVIMTCDEGARAFSDIQKFVDTKNNERDNMLRELEDLRAKLEVQAAKLTNEALMDLEEKARGAEITLQRFVDDTQNDITNRRNRIINSISSKMVPIFEKVAIEKGLDAITIFDPQRDAWINPALNVTEDIIKAYNQAYPAGAPTMPTAAKKP